jgi:hypothetical protein
MFQLGPARIPQGQVFPQGARINGAHPLAQSLGFMAVAQGAVAYDLVGGTAGVLTGTLAQKTLKWGQALTFAGATTNRLTWPTQTSSAWINAGTFSVSVLGSIVGSDFSPGSNTYPTLLKFASSGSHVGPGFENVSGNIFFCYVADNLTSVVGAVNLGNSANSNNLGFSGTNQPALYSWVVNGTSCACYINGVLIETLTVTHGAAVTAAIATANAAVGWGCGGAIQAWYVHNRPLDQSEIVALSVSPWAMLAPSSAADPFFFAGGGGAGAYTLTAAQGSFALTGQAANLLFGRKLTAAQASFTLNGQAVNFVHGYKFAAAQASFALSGQSANLLFNRKLTAAQGSFALTGFAANLVYTTVGAYTLTAAQGSFAFTGKAANLLFGRKVTAAQGSFSLTGQSANLLFNRLLSATRGSFTLTGFDAALSKTGARTLTADTGLFTLTGQPATLTYTPNQPAQTAFDNIGPVRKKSYRKEVEEDVQAVLAELEHVTEKAEAVVAAPVVDLPRFEPAGLRLNEAMRNALQVIDASLSAIERTHIQMALSAAREAQKRLEAKALQAEQARLEEAARVKRRRAVRAAAAYFFGDE